MENTMAAFDACKQGATSSCLLDAWIMCSISSTKSIYNNQKADNSPFVLRRCSMHSSDCSNRTWNGWLLKMWSWVDFCKSSARPPMSSSALLICAASWGWWLNPQQKSFPWYVPKCLKKVFESVQPCCSCDPPLMQIPTPQPGLLTQYTDLWVQHLETPFQWLRWGYIMCGTCQGKGQLVCTGQSSLIWFQVPCNK